MVWVSQFWSFVSCTIQFFFRFAKSQTVKHLNSNIRRLATFNIDANIRNERKKETGKVNVDLVSEMCANNIGDCGGMSFINCTVCVPFCESHYVHFVFLMHVSSWVFFLARSSTTPAKENNKKMKN